MANKISIAQQLQFIIKLQFSHLLPLNKEISFAPCTAAICLVKLSAQHHSMLYISAKIKESRYFAILSIQALWPRLHSLPRAYTCSV